MSLRFSKNIVQSKTEGSNIWNAAFGTSVNAAKLD